jgi:15-cis-phytoene synthase
MSARPEADTSRALALLYCPGAQHELLATLTGIESEVAASLAPGLEHSVAHARLAWWSEECARLQDGRGEHPLSRQLQALLSGNSRGALAGVRGFADAATWDLAGATFQTRRELDAYCGRWSAALVEPFAALALQQPVPAQVRAFGQALRALELTCALAGDARAGRVRVPMDELDAAGLAPQLLAGASWEPRLAEFVRQQHQRARGALAQAANGLPATTQPRLRALLVWATLAQQRSRRIVSALPAALPPGDHHAPLDAWRAWRAARRADAARWALPAD